VPKQTTEIVKRIAIGKRIAQARREMAVRERRDIRPVEVARAIGVSGAAVSDWENGKAVPGDDNMPRLAAFLGVTPEFLHYGVRDAIRVAPGFEIPLATLRRVPDEDLARGIEVLRRIEAERATLAAAANHGVPPSRRKKR
jgi:transcriptional regulator with XRE-family HTH domain